MSETLTVTDDEVLIASQPSQVLTERIEAVECLHVEVLDECLEAFEAVECLTLDAGEVLLEQIDAVSLIVGAEQGPPGPAGPAGDLYWSYEAAQTLSGHRAVYLMSDNRVDYASPAQKAHVYRLLGITTGAALAGATATVQARGLLIEPSWNFTPDELVYLGANGTLTQSVPTSDYLVVLGMPPAPTQLAINIQPPLRTV